MDEPRMQRLIQEWQGFVFNVCLRMLGRTVDAEDATQAVFERVLARSEAYDPSRAFKPWIAQVTRHVVRNRLRADKTREAKTEGYEQSAVRTAKEDPVERKEREAVVQGQLEQLPDDTRLLLTLHFYGGLNKSELAEALDVPRTTIQSRIASALESMKTRLAHAGFASLAPTAGDLMASTPAAPVPAHLTHTLTTLAAQTAAASTATAGLVVGGIVVTKKLIITVGVLLALSAGGGFVAARMTSDGAHALDTEASLLESAELARLEQENRRLSERLNALEDRGPQLSAGARAPREHVADQPRSAASTTPGAASAPKPGVDFGPFARAYAASFDSLLAAHGKDWEKLPAAHRARVLELIGALQQVSTQARLKSPTPFFEARLLSDFTDAVFGATVGFSKEERAALRTHTRTLLEREMADLDAAHSLPTQLYAARMRIVQGLGEHMRTAAPEDKQERASQVLQLSEDLLMGEREDNRIGLTPAPDGKGPASHVLTIWTRAFTLSESQLRTVGPLATRLADSAEQILRRYGQMDGGSALDAETEAAMNAEFLRLQIEAESAIERVLSSEQRAALRGVPPRLLRFFDGTGREAMTRRGGGI